MMRTPLVPFSRVGIILLLIAGMAVPLVGCADARDTAATASAASESQPAIPASSSLLSSILPADTAPVFQSERGPYRVVTVATGFKDPWSIAFLPSGDMLVTERPGRLRIVRNGVLQPEPVAGTPPVRYEGQGGLLEVARHPQFESNQLVYLTYSKPNADGTQGTTAVGRGRLEGNQLVDFQEIFEAKAWSTGGSHYGSRLAFDRNGYLFITVGDRAVDPLSMPVERHPGQDLADHQGSVIRLHDDGRVPSDNPFVGRAGALPEIWTYGHRNMQGLAVSPETGDVWLTEHGPQGGDELNLVLPGRNYGWPVIGYGVQYGGIRFHAGRERTGLEQPLQYWTPSIAPSGLMIYTGDRFPEWRGNLFAGGLDGRVIARVSLERGDNGYQVERLERPGLIPGFGRVRDVREGPDGYIYVAIDDRRGGALTPIVRLEPVEDEER
jgi:glucose/arabinose dehydrogenase